MKKIKWLWSIAIAMGIVLLYASLSAYFVKIDSWYFQLILPKFVPSQKFMTLAWSLAYILEISIIARLVFYREHTKVILPIVVLGILNIVWCMSFFTFKSPLTGFIVLIIQCVITTIIFIMLIRRDSISMILSQPLIAWYVYLAIVTYFIYSLN